MTTVWVGHFCRRGEGRDRLQDAVVVGTMVAATASVAPVVVEIDTERVPLFAVLDGVGGHAGGAVASRSAGHHLADLAAATGDPADLVEHLVEICRRITDEGSAAAALEGMGTTVAGVWFDGDRVACFNVGDSRVYLERDGYLTQCTVDDVVGTAPGAPLSQCLGAGIRHIDPHVTTVAWPDRGLALLCTDGFDRRLTLADIERALRADDPLQALWELADGADDDASVLLVDGRFAAAPAEPEPAVDLLFDPAPRWDDPHPTVPEVPDVRPAPAAAATAGDLGPRGLRALVAGITRRDDRRSRPHR